MRQRPGVHDRQLRCKVLVVDEASMWSQWFWEFVNRFLQIVRCNAALFGGIQLVPCGDFLQLPPVSGDEVWLPNSSSQRARSARRKLQHRRPAMRACAFCEPLHGFGLVSCLLREDRGVPEKGRFCFQSPTWHLTIAKCVELRGSHRQRNDPELAAALAEVRLGRVSSRTDALLRGLSRPLPDNAQGEAPRQAAVTMAHNPASQSIPNAPFVPTRADLWISWAWRVRGRFLHARRSDVRVTNLSWLDMLPGDSFNFRALDEEGPGIAYRLKQHPYPQDSECAAACGVGANKL